MGVRIERASLEFLADLDRHNEREWFLANKDRYQAAHGNMLSFADALIERMRRHDRIATANGRESLMRIYADQRFHKDRPPYAPRFGGRLARVKPELRGGYFFRIQPGDRSQVTCGFMGPEPADLKRIRTDIVQDHRTWQRLLSAKPVRMDFGGLIGDQLKTAPRGFPKDHAAIDLLRRTQFLLRHPFTDREVLAPDFLIRVDAMYRSVRPFFDHMSEVLTTDENGNSLLRRRP
ncbi:MAG: DUF2461 domain-containing protein [Flavobacteriales bacterium]